MNNRFYIGAAVFAGAAGALLIGASTAQAAPSTQQLTCDGQQVTLRMNDNNSSEMGGWSAAQVVSGGSGTLIPTMFDFSAYDETLHQSIFDGASVKGAGNANQTQSTVTCTQTQTASLGDLLDPGDPLPPGTSLDDQVTVTLTATAVWQK
jgi:hypothetical protein